MLKLLEALPFVAFFGCAIAQIWFGARVRRALASRHPAELEIIRTSYFTDLILPWRWVFSARHRELEDPDLTRKVYELRSLLAAGLVAWLACLLRIGLLKGLTG